MPNGRRTRRMMTRFTRRLLIIALGLSLAAGCQRLSVSRLQTPVLAPPVDQTPAPPLTPGPALPASPAAAPATTTPPAPRAAAPAAATVPVMPVSDVAATAPSTLPQGPTPPITAAVDAPPIPRVVLPKATPMLDAALQRAIELEQQDTTSRQATTAIQLPPVDIPAGEPGTLPELSPPAAPPRPAPEPARIDLKVEAAEALVARPAPESQPAAAPKPIDPDRPTGPKPPKDVWREGVDRLRSFAHDRAEKPEAAAPEVWALRARMLDWLEEPEDAPPSVSDSGSGSRSAKEATALRQAALTAMTALGRLDQAGDAADPAARAARIHAAVAVMEDQAPLEIVELQLCKRVKGFADYEPLDAAGLRRGQAAIVYCELAGLRHEPENDLFRSRLASRIELVPASGGEPVWTHSLGTADDVCHRRRRDFYVNYRITLPDSLAPGKYELRLIQDDLVASQSASRAVTIVIVP